MKQWDVIIHPWLKIWHRWVITSSLNYGCDYLSILVFQLVTSSKRIHCSAGHDWFSDLQPVLLTVYLNTAQTTSLLASQKQGGWRSGMSAPGCKIRISFIIINTPSPTVNHFRIYYMERKLIVGVYLIAMATISEKCYQVSCNRMFIGQPTRNTLNLSRTSIPSATSICSWTKQHTLTIPGIKHRSMRKCLFDIQSTSSREPLLFRTSYLALAYYLCEYT